MALTDKEKRDATALAMAIQTQTRARDDELRQNEIMKRQALRRVQQTNAYNGMNGGIEETNIARIASPYAQNRSSIMGRYNPDINEAQMYADLLARRRRGGSRTPEEDNKQKVYDSRGFELNTDEIYDWGRDAANNLIYGDPYYSSNRYYSGK